MPRKKAQPQGVPEWVVTYGDLMSLLLCFFILLAAFSELKKPREYRKVWDAIREAFGYVGGVGPTDTEAPPENDIQQRIEDLALQGKFDRTQEDSLERSTIGENIRVENIREGLMFTIGGPVAFAPGSATLPEGMKEELKKVAERIKGTNHVIRVAGHAYGQDKHNPKGLDYFQLGFARAESARDFLETQGIERSRIVLMSWGDTSPKEIRRYTPEEQAVNRRVDVIQTETLREETHPDPNYSGNEFSAGGSIDGG